jgi:two-component system phosphate regulon sensor histidine kinase PhoR
MHRRSLSAWSIFAAGAVVPIALVSALTWRARSAAIVEAREAEGIRVAQSAEVVTHEIEARFTAARHLLRALPSGSAPSSLAPPAGMRAFVLDREGELVVPPRPKPEAAASADCLEARRDLFGPTRPAARTTILAQCKLLRSESGRLLWPLLALEDAEGGGLLPAWLDANGDLLGDRQRATVRARAETLAGPLRERILALLARPSSEAVVLGALLAERGAETAEGELRVRRGAYVAVLRTFDDGRTAGLLAYPRSLVEGPPPSLPSDLSLVSGGEGGNVTITPELVLRVTPKDPAAAASRIANAGTPVIALAGASVAAALAFGIVLYARLLRARRLAELRTDFVAAVSHELRTPLASVLMLAELLEQGAVADDERPEVERSLAREARRLSETLTRMLRFGALGRGKLNASFAPANLAAVAADAAARFRQTHPDRAVEVGVPEALAGVVDAGLLGLALDNLLGNAAKYAPSGGPYRLTITTQRETLVIAVSDRGPGLTREAAARIFLPFERADDRLSRATEGTGIGLALVRGIAELHGGRARVESRTNEGATFIIEVPWKPC